MGYLGSSFGLKVLQIDDVIDASPVHYFCGIWGVLATGLFASTNLVSQNVATGHSDGLFYSGSFQLLGWQMMGVVAITAWTAGLTFAILFPMNYIGSLRMSEEEEKLGLDKVMA